jgi:hypothetical protein
MKNNNLSDHNNKWPIKECKIFKAAKNARIELTSLDEAKRFRLMRKIPILDRECKIT